MPDGHLAFLAMMYLPSYWIIPATTGMGLFQWTKPHSDDEQARRPTPSITRLINSLAHCGQYFIRKLLCMPVICGCAALRIYSMPIWGTKDALIHFKIATIFRYVANVTKTCGLVQLLSCIHRKLRPQNYLGITQAICSLNTRFDKHST